MPFVNFFFEELGVVVAPPPPKKKIHKGPLFFFTSCAVEISEYLINFLC